MSALRVSFGGFFKTVQMPFLHLQTLAIAFTYSSVTLGSETRIQSLAVSYLVFVSVIFLVSLVVVDGTIVSWFLGIAYTVLL
jgi:hypothetical protein